MADRDVLSSRARGGTLSRMGRAVPPNWIESIRLRLLMSHHELAARVCCSRQTIRSIERGESIPSVTLALAIARELETTVEDLFGCAELR